MPDETILTNDVTATPKPPDSAKVWIQRTNGEPCILLPYNSFESPGRYSHYSFPATESEFEVSADVAAAAIASGHFVERTGSKTKSKANPPAGGN